MRRYGILLVALLLSLTLAYGGEVEKKEKIPYDDYFKQRCIEHGFQFEYHSVTTDDGYILMLFRIPGEEGKPTNKRPVLLIHG